MGFINKIRARVEAKRLYKILEEELRKARVAPIKMADLDAAIAGDVEARKRIGME